MTENRFLIERWFEAWASLGILPCPELGRLHADLVRRYAEPHRRYHTLRHLAECFGHWDELEYGFDDRAEIELALWYHDAVYDTRRHDNEEASARLAAKAAASLGVAEPVTARIVRLIVGTRHATEPEGHAAAALADADLGILGAPPERFKEYEAQIRQEYAWVPEPEFRAERAKILARLLERMHLFATEPFRSRHEARARANLRKSLAQLKRSF